MDLVLVLLQPNQPPAADTHYKERQDASQYHSRDESTCAASGQGYKDAAPRSRNQDDRECEMALP